MSLIKSRGSKIETRFWKALWGLGFRYKRNSSKYFGKPDIVFEKFKTAIFIDSCFWHGCKNHCRMPTSRRNYWAQKIDRNRKRDKKVSKFYKNLGWNLVRVWEHQAHKNFQCTLDKIITCLN